MPTAPNRERKDTETHTHLRTFPGCARCLLFAKKAHRLPWRHSYKKLQRRKRRDEMSTEGEVTMLSHPCLCLTLKCIQPLPGSTLRRPRKQPFLSRDKYKVLEIRNCSRRTVNTHNAKPAFPTTLSGTDDDHSAALPSSPSIREAPPRPAGAPMPLTRWRPPLPPPARGPTVCPSRLSPWSPTALALRGRLVP